MLKQKEAVYLRLLGLFTQPLFLNMYKRSMVIEPVETTIIYRQMSFTEAILFQS
jgi:hypothetical protein